MTNESMANVLSFIFLFFNQFVVCIQGSPDAEAGFRIHLFHLVVEMFDVCAMRVRLVGTEFLLFLIASHFCVDLDILFLYHAERSDDGQWHLTHLEARWHRVEAPLKGEVHQGCMDEIVLMMAECYLVAAEFLSEVEEFFASHPGA